MASIHERTRADGTLSYQVRWREDGRVVSTTCPSPRAAKKVKAIVEATGTYSDEMGREDVPTVADQLEIYLRDHTRGNGDTQRDYRRIYDQHIAPAFGELALTSLTVPMLTKWGRGLTRKDRRGHGQPVSDKTRANVTAVMSGLLESAVPDVLSANPWRKVRLPKTDGPREAHFLRAEDFGLILAEIPEHYRPAVLILGTTGLRWGEASALTVGDVEIRGALPVLRVTKAVKHRARQTDAAGVPKTEKAVRLVTAPPELADVIRALVDGRPKAAPLFPTVRGKRLRNSTFHTLVWQPALDRATAKGLPFRPRIHDLRAAAVSWLLDAKLDPWEVADMMGHESIATTMEIYRRANPEAGKKAAAAMSGLLAKVTRGAIEP